MSEHKPNCGVAYAQEADPNRIVIATRKESESRRLLGAEGLAACLSSMGYNVTMATMGDLSFEQQLHLVADAKALVGVHGSLSQRVVHAIPRRHCRNFSHGDASVQPRTCKSSPQLWQSPTLLLQPLQCQTLYG